MMLFSGATPRHWVPGYMRQLRPMIEPGERTELQPISARSPMIAPNFRRPVGMIAPLWVTVISRAVEADIGEDDAGGKVALVADNGIADVIEMRDFRFVEDDRVLEFARVAHGDAVADDDIFADIAAVADFAALADPRGAFDHGAVLDDGALADEDGAGDERLADEAAVDRGLQPELEIAADLLESVPGVEGVLEELAMIGMIQVEEGFGSKHGRGRGKIRKSKFEIV